MYDADTTGWDEFERPVGHRPTDEVERIARYQRWLIWLILAQLALWAWAGVVGGDRAELLLVAFTLAGAAFVFMLESTLNGVLAGFLGGMMSLIPGLGVVIQAVANRAATAELTKHGATVGTFGASPADVKMRPALYYDDADAGW